MASTLRRHAGRRHQRQPWEHCPSVWRHQSLFPELSLADLHDILQASSKTRCIPWRTPARSAPRDEGPHVSDEDDDDHTHRESKVRRPESATQPSEAVPNDAPYLPGTHTLAPATHVELIEETPAPLGALEDFGQRMHTRLRRRRSAGSSAWIDEAFGNFLVASSARRRKEVPRADKGIHSGGPDDGIDPKPPDE